jgi:hypothetical protein
LKELEARRILSASERQEMENLQNSYVHGLTPRIEPEVDPQTGLRMEYQPAQISSGYDPKPVDGEVLAAYRRKKGLPEKDANLWRRIKGWFRR